MNGFISTNAETIAGTIVNDGFFPDIDVANFAEVMKIREQVIPPRIRYSLRQAIILVNQRLAKIKISNTTLSDIPSETIDEQSQKVLLYTEAVYTCAKALILEDFRNYDLTLEGNSQADQAEESVDDNRRRCIAAISQLLGGTSANQAVLI